MTGLVENKSGNQPLIRTVVLNSVWNERRRQEDLVRTGRFKFTAANPGLTNAERFPMLAEELGEVAKQIQQQPDSGLMPVGMDDKYDWRKAGDSVYDPNAGTITGLEKELIQLAAIAVAWCEALHFPRDGNETAPTPIPETPPSAA